MTVEIKNLPSVLSIDGNEELILEHENNNYRLKLKQLHKTNINMIYPHIDGDMTAMNINDTRLFTVTNFDTFSNYTLVPICGTAELIDDIVHYTAPSTTGLCGFVINGRPIEIEIIENEVCNIIISGQPEYGDRFGWSVAISGDGTRIVVGENYTNSYYSGSARVFVKNNENLWVQEFRFYSRAQEGYRDNYSVSLDIDYTGTRIAVSANHEKYFNPDTQELSGNEEGAVYIYVRNISTNAWTLEQLLLPDLSKYYGEFGTSVKFNKDASYIIVGANGEPIGSAYIFVRTGSTWTLEETLSPSDSQEWGEFGWSVAINELADTVAVGATYRSINPIDNDRNGAVYIYKKTNNIWSETQIIIPDRFITANPSGMEFGYSLAMNSDGTKLIVGAPRLSTVEDTHYEIGAIFIYDLVAGIYLPHESIVGGEHYFLTSRNDQDYEYFGISIDISDDGKIFIVGAYNTNTFNQNGEGTAIMYSENISGEISRLHYLYTDPITDPYTNPNSSDHFGQSVTITSNGLQIAVGAPDKIITIPSDYGDTVLEQAGAVYPCLTSLASNISPIDS